MGLPKLPAPPMFGMRKFIEQVTGCSDQSARLYETAIRRALHYKQTLYGNLADIHQFHEVCKGEVPHGLADAAKRLNVDIAGIHRLAKKVSTKLPVFRGIEYVTKAQLALFATELAKEIKILTTPPPKVNLPLSPTPTKPPVATAPIGMLDSLSRLEERQKRIESKLDQLLAVWK